MSVKILLILFMYLIYDVWANTNNDKPDIPFTKLETVVEANDNHSIFCQGNRPLKWKIPDVENEKSSWTTFNSIVTMPTKETFKYGLKLNIVNMSYPFVGFYYCYYSDSDPHQIQNQSASVYLYVNDPNHLSTLNVSKPFVKLVRVVAFNDVIIPCKPTSPDVKVQLFKYYKEVPLDVLSADGTVFRYNPLYGFTSITNSTQAGGTQRVFECIFTKNQLSQTSSVRVIIEYPVDHVELPSLRKVSIGHTVVGDKLILECTIKTLNGVNFHWDTPNTTLDDKRILMNEIDNIRSLSQNLTIRNVTLSDNGTYYCNITDNQGHSSSRSLDVKIFSLNEYFLTIEYVNNISSLTSSAGKSSIEWNLKVRGHPIPEIVWLNNRNETISMGMSYKYEVFYNTSVDIAYLRIKNVKIEDFGHYTLVAKNNKTDFKTVFLIVTDKPSIKVDVEPFYRVNTSVRVKCRVSAYPQPNIQWYIKPCQSNTCAYQRINGTIIKSKEFEFSSEVRINSSKSGYVKCIAENRLGKTEVIKEFIITDVNNGFDIFDFDSGIELQKQQKLAVIAEGYKAAVTCGASRQYYCDITWIFNNTLLSKSNRFVLINSSTQYSNKVRMEIQHANFSDSGLYRCRVKDLKNGQFLYQNIYFKVQSPTPPHMVNTSLHDEIEIRESEKLVLYCHVSGIPKPTLKWFKNGDTFRPSDAKRVHVSENNEIIIFYSTVAADGGRYKCQATNNVGSIWKEQNVVFLSKNMQTWQLGLITLLSLVCFGAIIYIVVKIIQERQKKIEIKSLGLEKFQKGAVENINPNIRIDDQAELLPYDKKWEFPKENLKLGKQLGSGAYGVVMKAVAKNIVQREEETIVAVKMIKKNADFTYIKALASELKIMAHLGKHLNIVNLLGACTKNVAYGELLVIVEYCRFGNLQSYLLRHRDVYIDEINPETGEIEDTYNSKFREESCSVSSYRGNPADNNNVGNYNTSSSGIHSQKNNATFSLDKDCTVINKTYVANPRRYIVNFTDNLKTIYTTDLLSWAFQVARGMEYLASRKVLHGDLAARNILLSDNNIIKICDFGLAKNMYKNYNYKKRKGGLLPLKWMAIESIRDGLFSTQSDVWAFGIVLWEIFSLARTPYPGMESDERLYKKLLEGYRMEPPQFAPRDVYKMMTACWSSQPLARPSFTQLSEQLGLLLDDAVRNYYIDLNDQYLLMNTQMLKDGHNDYLAMLNPPTYETRCTPHYVNEIMVEESQYSDYLTMKSPRDTTSASDVNEEENAMELVPMLQNVKHSSSEKSVQSTASLNCVLNPSYNFLTKVNEIKNAN